MGPWSTIPTRGGTRVSGKGWRNSCCKIIIMGKRYYYDERTWLTSNKQKAKSWGWEAIAPLLPPPPPPIDVPPLILPLFCGWVPSYSGRRGPCSRCPCCSRGAGWRATWTGCRWGPTSRHWWSTWQLGSRPCTETTQLSESEANWVKTFWNRAPNAVMVHNFCTNMKK